MLSSSFQLIIEFILGVLVPPILVIGSILLLIIKIIERKKEKKNEDMDKYDKY